MGLLKRSSIYLLSNVLNAIVPFILLPVLTRYLSPDEYGQIAMFQTLVAGLSALTGLNAVGAANRKFYDDANDKLLANFNGNCLNILFFSSCVVVVLCFLSADYISECLSIPKKWIYFAIVISIPNFIIQFRLGQWQILEQAISFGVMQVSQSVIVMLLSLALVGGLKQGATGRVDALLYVTILYAFISLLLLYQEKLLIIFPLKKDHLKEAILFGVPLIPHVVGIFLLSSIDRFFINRELGVAEAGIYMLAVQLSLGMAVVFDAINKALVPWLFRALADRDPLQLEKVVKFTYLFFIVVFILGLLSFVVGPLIVTFVAGEPYQRAGAVIGWLCHGQAFSGMYLMVTNYIFYAKKTGPLSIITISTGLINILLISLLIGGYGIVGVAIAFSASMALRFIGTFIIAIRASNISWGFSIFKRKANVGNV